MFCCFLKSIFFNYKMEEDIYEKIKILINIFDKIRLVFVILGLIGNLCMFVVYTRNCLKKLSVSTYFRAMALSYLCVNINWLRIFHKSQFNWHDFINYSEFTCKFLSYLLNLLAPLTAWFEVVATIDRFLTIIYSNRFKFIQKPLFQLIVVIFTILLQMIINLLMYFSSERVELENSDYNYCRNTNEFLLDLIDLINLAALPFIFMLLFSIATIWGLSNLRNSLAGIASIQSRSKTRDIKFGVTLIFFNLTFFILNAPHRIFNAFNLVEVLSNDNLFIKMLLICIVSIISELQYSTCFYIHLAVNNLVRKEFFNLCKSCANQLTRLARSIKSSTYIWNVNCNSS